VRWSVLFLSFALLIASCTSQTGKTPEPTSLPTTASAAQQTLIKLFSLLNAGQYVEAEPLYGGSYELMQTWNPDVEPSDHTALWTRACEQNGLQCLEVRTATFKNLQGDTHVFQVEFSNPDGSLFVLGPCCGSNETEMPPVSQFEYTVTKNAEGKFVVKSLPPYVP